MHGECVWCVNLKKKNCSCVYMFPCVVVYVCMYSVYLWVHVVCVYVWHVRICVCMQCVCLYIWYIWVCMVCLCMVRGPKEVEGHVSCILTEARYLKTDLVKGKNVSILTWIANNNDNTSVTGFPEVCTLSQYSDQGRATESSEQKAGRAGLKSKESQMHLG